MKQAFRDLYIDTENFLVWNKIPQNSTDCFTLVPRLAGVGMKDNRNVVSHPKCS